MEQYKTCTKCKANLPTTSFYKCSKNKSGLMGACISCSKLAVKSSVSKKPEHYKAKKQEWVAANRDRKQQYWRNYYAKDPEKFRKRSRDWGNQNKAWRAEKNRQYKEANKERLLAAQKEKRKNNPEKVFSGNHVRRQRMADNGLFVVTKKDFLRLMSSPCLYCGGKTVEIDHIIPLSRGGRHSIGNLAPSCGPCNRSKSNKFVTEFQKYKRELKGD